MLVASLSGSLTSFIGNHGLYAVFALMAVDAVFPAASELVMLYAGALAAGVFAGQHVSLLGSRIGSGFGAYLALALAGTIGYLAGSVVGWGIGIYGGRPLLERRGRLFHLSEAKLVRAERWFDRWDDWAVLLGRVTPVVRSFVSIPARFSRSSRSGSQPSSTAAASSSAPRCGLSRRRPPPTSASPRRSASRTAPTRSASS